VHDAPPIASASTSAPAQGVPPADEDDGDDDDDGDDGDDGDIWDPPDYTARAAGGGLSVAVSAMAAPAPSTEEDGHRPLHALALGGDAGALRAYLDAHPGAGVDELDDYVRILSVRGTGSCVDACVGIHAPAPGVRPRARRRRPAAARARRGQDDTRASCRACILLLAHADALRMRMI
jgi:hypothetical protein